MHVIFPSPKAFSISLSVFRLVAFFHLILSIQAFSRREPDAELVAPKFQQ